MKEALRSPAKVLLITGCFALAILLLIVRAEAATNGLPCDNPRLPTAAEVAAGVPAGIPACLSDFRTAVGDDGSAKVYLNSLPKHPLSQCAPPTAENINKLNPTFAICAAQFLKAYTETYGGVYITSAFRDGAPGSAGDGSGRSANACAGGARGSNHQRGIAMDLYPNNGNFQQLWNFASQNPQFGVCFPYKGSDRPHMGLAGTGTGEAARCAAQGVTRPCDGSNFDPNSIRTTNTTPTSGLADRLRQTITPEDLEEKCELPDGLIVPCSSIANRKNPTTPSGQGDAAGGGNPAQALPSSEQPLQYLPPSQPVSNLVLPETKKASSTKSALSSFEQIKALVGSKTPTSSAATSTPFILVVNGQDAASISNQNVAKVTPLQEGAQQLIPPTNQNTFVSGDLSGGAQSSMSAQQTGLQKTLTDMRNTLLRALEYLKPFGRPASQDKHNDGYY